MTAAGKLGGAELVYGSAPEIARARVRNGPRFGVAASGVATATRTGKARTATAVPDKTRSAHAEQSAARSALLEAQAGATPALERMPAALRAGAVAAHLSAQGGTDFDAAAEAALNRLRDARPEQAPRSAAPPSEAEAQKATTAYQQAMELPS